MKYIISLFYVSLALFVIGFFGSVLTNNPDFILVFVISIISIILLIFIEAFLAEGNFSKQLDNMPRMKYESPKDRRARLESIK